MTNNKNFFLISGPCVIESRENAFLIAKTMKEITGELDIPYIFKASFDKANRSSLSSFRGHGMEEGLEILGDIRKELNLRVITDIHSPEQADIVAKVVDILQIPAFLARQTDLILAAARTGLPVNVKKPQFCSPFDMKNVVEKFKSVGNKQLMLCERGTSFGYNTLVVDMTGLYEMRKFGCPVVFDATHSVQKPGGLGTSSGGNREYVRYLSRAAIAVGIDGLFLEVHPEPEKALSDGPNMVPLSDVKPLLEELIKIHRVVVNTKI
ncbi:MAG: 3-deoxy-8-phosphooctulonate synthase [Defluviitaleaceae bacterium]|nr:3-deoxy-8-phosphooctulonate synthase [Defluviitaleaceae bacterium]